MAVDETPTAWAIRMIQEDATKEVTQQLAKERARADAADAMLRDIQGRSDPGGMRTEANAIFDKVPTNPEDRDEKDWSIYWLCHQVWGACSTVDKLEARAEATEAKLTMYERTLATNQRLRDEAREYVMQRDAARADADRLAEIIRGAQLPGFFKRMKLAIAEYDERRPKSTQPIGPSGDQCFGCGTRRSGPHEPWCRRHEDP